MPPTTAPLVPKAPGSELQVVAIGRISTVHQDVENIEASYRYIQDYLGRIYRGPMNIRLLGEQASGMLTDRATIREAEDLVAGGKVDLVIAEDLARIYRNPRYQYDFVQNAVDVGTRVICIGDNLDTADENWEISMGAAALRHGLHIPDTRRRVRRTATHSFHKGGMVQKIRYRLSQTHAGRSGFGAVRPQRSADCQATGMHAGHPGNGPTRPARRDVCRHRRLARIGRHLAGSLRGQPSLVTEDCGGIARRSDPQRNPHLSGHHLPTGVQDGQAQARTKPRTRNGALP